MAMILRSLSEQHNFYCFLSTYDSFSTDERFLTPRTNILFRGTYIYAVYLYVAFLTIRRDERSSDAIVENRQNLGFR